MRARRTWSRALVLREIKQRRRAKLPLNGKAIHNEDGSLYQKAREYFGGWKAALRAAGFSERNARRRKPYWTKTVFKKTLRQLRRAGTHIHEQYLRKNGLRRVMEAGIALYGTWRAAVEAIGYGTNT